MWRSSHSHLWSARTRLMSTIRVDNPYTLETYCEVTMAGEKKAQEIVTKAHAAQQEWKNVALKDRQELCKKWTQELDKQKDSIAKDITGQMGKPLKQSYGEINGTLERANVLLELSNEALATDTFNDSSGQFRQIVKEPVGTTLIMAPWNYPLMTAVNAIIPALLAGNSIVLKHSPRTPLCAHHYVDTFKAVGLPEGLLTALHCKNDVVASVIQRQEIGFVSFTGSVQGGREINKVAGNRLIHTTLELGGKDAAYVAEDANIEAAAGGLVDGACYNAGQSCCGIERVYVAQSKYDEFIQHARQHIEAYELGDPMDEATTLGPMAQDTQPDFLQRQVDEAIAQGARLISTTGKTTDSAGKGRFFTPTLLVDCTHSMQVMREESFGPIMAVAPINSDAEALEKINDCQYGLTAAVFTKDKERAMRLAANIQAGTVYMNRCDALDPYLAWTGVANTGKGQSLSKYGFSAFTQLKSYNFNLNL